MNINEWDILSYSELENKVDLTSLDSSVFAYRDQFPEAIYAYYDGNLSIDGNLTVEDLFDKLNQNSKIHLYGIWINGSLTVENSLINDDPEDMSHSLVIKEDLNSKNIIVGGIRIQVLKNLNTDVVFYKENSEGALISSEFKGNLYIDPWEQVIKDRKGNLINITQENCKIISEMLVKEVLAPIEEFDLDSDDYFELSYLIIEDYLLPFLTEGKSIFINKA